MDTLPGRGAHHALGPGGNDMAQDNRQNPPSSGEPPVRTGFLREDRALARREARRTQHWREFVRGLARMANVPEERAEQITISVLCALEMRLTDDESVQLENQLPQRLQEMVWR